MHFKQTHWQLGCLGEFTYCNNSRKVEQFNEGSFILQWLVVQCILCDVAIQLKSKLTEVLIDIVLVLVIGLQAGLDIRMRGRVHLGFTQVIQTMMLMTLLCNLAFNVNHELSWFYYLESLVYDWYFCTLVFYVTYRIMDKSNRSDSLNMRVLKGSYAAIMVLFLAVFVYSGVSKIIECKQIWFITIDISGLIICSITVRIGYQHHQEQIDKMMDFKSEDQINNPLFKMWALILINLFCQLVQLVESLIFLLQPSGCHFTSSESKDVIIKFLFSFFSLHLSFICTIVIFHLRRDSEKSYSQMDTSLREGLNRAPTLENGNELLELGLIPPSSDGKSTLV